MQDNRISGQAQASQSSAKSTQAQTSQVGQQPAQVSPQQPQSSQAPEQTYSHPLVISSSLTRTFAALAVACVLISVVLFVVKNLGRPTGDSFLVSVYDTAYLVLQRVNTVAIFARIACLGFAVAASIIRVLNPHPYNTKTLITAWVGAVATFLALIIFR